MAEKFPLPEPPKKSTKKGRPAQEPGRTTRSKAAAPPPTQATSTPLIPPLTEDSGQSSLVDLFPSVSVISGRDSLRPEPKKIEMN